MSAQPPTPPREVSKAVDDAISFLDDSHEIERTLSKSLVQRRPSLQAAVPSPAPSQESAATSTSKKVGFSPHTVYHQPQGHNLLELHGTRPAKQQPSTRPGKPLKSILKLTHAPPPTPDDLDSKLSYFSPDVPGSFARMLQSVLNQLASQSVSSRLDAYLTLNGALQTYGDVPDAAALIQKLGLLTQFLARDMAWKNSDGKLDTNIALQALKLTNVLLFNDNISAALDGDFRCFLVDRSISVMESTETPKQIMKAHVHLLAQPKLQAAAINASRADKILNALQTIDQRCSGNNVVSIRLVIYQRLLEQAPTLMLTRAREWLEQTFHCMLSSISDIRGRAIDTCTKGGIRLGTQPHAAKAMSDFLDTEIDEGQSYYQYFSAKIMEMLGDKETAPCVPRIWSALVLYFRNRRKPLEKWAGFRSWLVVIQKCLNSSDIMVRYEATLAWNKLVYTATSDASLSTSMMKMLKTPIVSGIERRGHDSFSRQIRQHAIECYHNFLHYGLRPNLSAQELESAWDILVDPILSSMVKASAKGQTAACRIMCGLLSSNGGVWNANAALMATPIRSEDLPRLDPRWIRSNIAKVLKVLQSALRSCLWSSQELNTTVHSAWAALMQTISDAGAQEVKTSNDLKQAIAHLVGVSRQLWGCRLQPPRDGNIDHFQGNYVSLLEAMISTIGPGHFTEDFLATSDSDLIEVAPTPSTKRSRHQSAPQSPIVLILRPLFAHEGADTEDQNDGPPSTSDLLQLFVSSRPTTLAGLDFLARAYFALQNTDSPSGYDQSSLWKAFANSMTLALKSYSSTAQQQQPGSLGPSLKHSTDVFSAGLRTVIELEPMTSLYDAMYEAAKQASNDGGIVVGVMEPVAKAIASEGALLPVQRKLQLTERMLSQAVWPKTRQCMECARKTLWGVVLAPQKTFIFDPFDQVYNVTVDTMISMYEKLDDCVSWNPDAGRHFFATVVAFLEQAPLSLLLTGLRRTQVGFAAWIQDEARKTGSDDGESQQILPIWTSLLRLIDGLPSSDNNLLKALEPLLVAGFSSPRRQIVNETILFWNAKFGREESLEYPAQLESVLRARMLDASIELPTFPDSNNEHVPATLPGFFDSESQPAVPAASHPQDAQMKPHHQEAGRSAQPAQSVYFTAQKSPVANERPAPSTIDRRSAASGSSTPKARLRHDDSQIQFAPIDSSPIRFEEESQHLTEHQMEVKERQSAAALMFPELSSSPMAQSTALPRALSKRLDFSTEGRRPEQGEDAGTPTALPDAAGLMSDDMPSSPTPSSNKDASQAALDADDDQATEDELDEPPSSPPRDVDREEVILQNDKNHSEAIGPDDTTVTDFGLTDVEDASALPMAGIGSHAEPSEPEGAVDQEDDVVDLPSDSILPTEQLRLEAEAADLQGETSTANINDADDTTVVAEAGNQDAVVPREVKGPESGAEDLTRVEDSFIGQPQIETAAEEDGTNSQSSRKPTRKRKRPSSVVYTAKKQKSASPFKRFISKIWPNSQQDDDDMEDEIVVASSQRSQSPSSPMKQQPATSSPSQQVEEGFQPVDEPATDLADVKQEVMPPPPKRRPGRPRKSATPTPSLSESQDETPQTRSLKRQASGLSNVSATETDVSSSFVKDTPAPSKSRKTRKGQTSSQGSDTASPQQESQRSRTTRRTATAVLIPPPKADAQAEAEDASSAAADAAEVVSTPRKSTDQAANAVSAASTTDERPKLTPRSILGRLRDALSDFVGMKVSTAEAREFDDVLFEFRREVHEADRRGRNEDGK